MWLGRGKALRRLLSTRKIDGVCLCNINLSRTPKTDRWGCIPPAEPGIYTFTDSQLIGDCQEHATKIQNCLGSAALANVADKPAIHSAVSLGTSSFVVEYARKMSQGLVSPAFQACEAAGVDAGLHDYLLYNGDAQGVMKLDQASGPVTDVKVWSATHWVEVASWCLSSLAFLYASFHSRSVFLANDHAMHSIPCLVTRQKHHTGWRIRHLRLTCGQPLWGGGTDRVSLRQECSLEN